MNNCNCHCHATKPAYLEANPCSKFTSHCQHWMNNPETVENKVAALITSFIEQEIGRIDLRKELVQVFNSELALRDKQLREEVNNIPRVTMKIKNLKTKDYDDLDVIPVKDVLSLLEGEVQNEPPLEGGEK